MTEPHSPALAETTEKVEIAENKDTTTSVEITEKDRELAQSCLQCPVCRRARKRQRGLFFWFVKKIEEGKCPACQAYEKVYGRKAHEPEI